MPSNHASRRNFRRDRSPLGRRNSVGHSRHNCDDYRHPPRRTPYQTPPQSPEPGRSRRPRRHGYQAPALSVSMQNTPMAGTFQQTMTVTLTPPPSTASSVPSNFPLSSSGRRRVYQEPLLFTEEQILHRIYTELCPANKSVLDIIHREFGIPPDKTLNYQLSAVDLDPDTRYSTWRSGKWRLWNETRGAALILAPTLHAYVPRTRSNVHNSGLSDRAYADAAMRVLGALKPNGPSHLHGIPFPTFGELTHCSIKFRDEYSGETHAMNPISLVYLPYRDPHGFTLYERCFTEAPGAKAQLARWAAQWGVNLRAIVGDRAFVTEGYANV
ncbi:uncharacterized protein F4822DRAFT_200515 [Hypoxylon trugodes]|uniref:uncharacterized protein n=1 Tax=Hypoxylon trugodes TaxID=326681 RepID=UPI00218E5AEC|nr:uncharacterized protein F4822DRAFT_200515 [Hypoxylon trugodes]KAI1389450.1 hypothetical protein F4822DRAFT_200515 [Hypoxylon trugodes]